MYSKKFISQLLKKVKEGSISINQALEELENFPYANLKFARIDTHRFIRKGFPEVIYCPGKTITQLKKIIKECSKHNSPLLLTRASPKIYKHLKKYYPSLKFNKICNSIFKHGEVCLKKGIVSVITAGTTDIPVAEEACVTLEITGNKVRKIYDIGASGLHRTLDIINKIKESQVIVIVAGMEGTLPGIIAGLIAKPVIAVPTSTGYGANFAGLSSLLTMLNSCSPGIVVVNIDNGFGAGYFANLINH